MRILLLLLVISVQSFSQETLLPINADGKVEYVEVVQKDSIDAKALYSKSKLFIANAFVSAKDVTQLADDDTKTIVVKGLIPVTTKALGSYYEFGDFRFKFTIQCKDGRFKYSVTDFVHKYTGSKKIGDGGNIENEKPACGTLMMTKKQWAGIKEQLDEKVKNMIIELKKSMQSTTSNDW